MIDNISRLREIQIDLIKDLARVCQTHGLKYYAFFGTLLGIQRNQGYLPWDDDVDIVMPKEDYVLLANNPQWFAPENFLQTPLDEGGCAYMKLRRNGTTAFRKNFVDSLREGGHHGIAIDIIPLEEIPGADSYHTPTMRDWDKKNASFLKSWFEPAGQGKFEDLTLPIPACTRKVLTEVYKDWAWPSGAMESKPNYWFFDTETDYKKYVKRYTGMLEDISGKKIYLFGAADSLRIWLERFGLKDQVECTFDNDRNKWGSKAYGLEVKNPDQIPSLLDGNSRLIIVSLWHQEIGAQLEAMGIDDYYVYLDNYYDEKVGKKVVRREDANSGNIPLWQG